MRYECEGIFWERAFPSDLMAAARGKKAPGRRRRKGQALYMEINAKVYAVADDEALLGKAHLVLREKTFQRYNVIDRMEPCTALPLAKTWYGFAERSEPTNDPETWLDCLRECARVLGKRGAVIVEFRSPDAPDDYLEYAWTTPAGNAGCGGRLGLIGYDRALGNKDISMALDELFSGRNAQERARESRRLERKEALRREKGDFEITGGVLKKYRGNDTEVVIPAGVKVIGESAFVDMKGVERMIMECEEYDAPPMETLVIPDGVEEIRYYAFAYCANLKEVYIPDSVRVIGGRAFEGCESLKKVRLPAGLDEIAEDLFFLCWDLKAIEIPAGVRHIREGAFRDCPLSRFTLPEGLESIGARAFDSCRVQKVRIPKSVKGIGNGAFPKGTVLVDERL